MKKPPFRLRSLRAAYLALTFDLMAWASRRSIRDADIPAMFVFGMWLLPQLELPTSSTDQPVQAWIQLVYYAIVLVISAVISYAMAPKPTKPKPAALRDFDVPTAEEGRPIAVLFGDYLVEDPNVLWWGDLSSKPVKSKAGKK